MLELRVMLGCSEDAGFGCGWLSNDDVHRQFGLWVATLLALLVFLTFVLSIVDGLVEKRGGGCSGCTGWWSSIGSGRFELFSFSFFLYEYFWLNFLLMLFIYF